MTRRTREETRTLLLDTGADLARRNMAAGCTKAVDTLFATVRVADVVEALGLTTGSAYQIWPSQLDYRRDLFFHVVEKGQAVSGAGVDDVAEDVAQCTTPEEFARVVARRVQEELAGNDLWKVFISAVPLAANAEVRVALQKRYETGHDTDVRPMYEAGLALYGLEMRPPYVVDDLIVAMTALLEGMTLRRLVEPDRTDETVAFDADGSGVKEWGLGSAAAVAVIRFYTRERDPAAPERVPT